MSSFLGLAYADPVSVEMDSLESVARTLDGGHVAMRTGSPRWRVALTLEPGGPGADAALAAHRARHGISQTFALPMPQVAPGTIVSRTGQLTTGAAAAGATAVSVSASTTVEIPAGWFVSFTGSARVHQVQSAVTVGRGGVSMSIFPALAKAVGSGVRWNPAPNLTCRYVDGSGGYWESSRVGVVTRSIEVIEA